MEPEMPDNNNKRNRFNKWAGSSMGGDIITEKVLFPRPPLNPISPFICHLFSPAKQIKCEMRIAIGWSPWFELFIRKGIT